MYSGDMIKQFSDKLVSKWGAKPTNKSTKKQKEQK